METPNRNLIIALLLTILSLADTRSAHADGTKEGSQFGILYGLSVPDADNTKTFRMIGIEGKAFVSPMLSLGGYYAQSDKSGQRSSQEQFYYSLTGVEAAYHMPSATGDTFIATRIGITKLTETMNNTEFIFSPYHYGVVSGYDYYLGSYVSVGFEGSYLHVLPGRTTDSAGAFYNSNSFNIITFLVSLQLHL